MACTSYDQMISIPHCHFDISDFDGCQPAEKVKRVVEKHAQASS